jgi:hypothetical protein
VSIVLRWTAALAAAIWALAPPAHARVESVDLYQRAEVLGGRSFGDSGPYEKLSGVIHFAFDPDNAANARIVDLDKAPTGTDGRVGASADFMVLRPKDALKGRGIALLEVSNRGGKASLAYFNRARSSTDPDAQEDYGDGFLMRQGLTVIWVGWQFDVPYDPGLLRLRVPIANEDGVPIYGLVRSDWIVDEAVNTLPLGHRGHWGYPVAWPDDARNVLTRRAGHDARREVVPRTSWQFAREMPGGRVVPDLTQIHSAQGFQSGYIYELVYVARDPRVAGLGLAAVRDTLSYAKHDETSLFPVEQGVGFGVSQSGRFLRHFLYQGFNVDERGRKVFDGMLIHTAGAGRGSFNHRFAQPSRDAHRYSSFFYPTDLFPFSGRTQRDPVSGAEDGLLAIYKDAAQLPKIMYTNTSYEYWARGASMITTAPDAGEDVAPLENERLYVLSGGQHYVGAWPPPARERIPGSSAYPGNPLDFLPTMRALMAHLVEWVAEDREPPASAYPTIREQTLVAPEALNFPVIPGVTRPKVVYAPSRLDYGPRWAAGIVDKEPPEIGAPFPVRVPQVDVLGNDQGGVRGVELRVPLATYTGWSLRTGLANPGELADFKGLFIPLPRSLPDATESGDARPAITTLYASREEYLAQATGAAHTLLEQGYLLEEDLPAVAERAAALWDWIFQNGAH